MASPKVQLIRDFGCGLGAFTTSQGAEVLEGVAGRHQDQGGPGVLLLSAEGKTAAVIVARGDAPAAGLPVVECRAALEGITAGNRLRIDFSAGRIDDLTTGRSFTFTRA